MKKKIMGCSNMNSNQLLNFLYTLMEKKIKIWCNDDKIKVLLPPGIILTTLEKEVICDYKTALINLLKNNQIDSDKVNKMILRHDLQNTPLSFAQERLWFLQKYENNIQSYNVPMVFKISPKVNLSILKKSFEAIILRHESLRTHIKEDINSNAYQSTLQIDDIIFQVETCIVNNEIELDNALHKDVYYLFDLSSEYPIRIILYNLNQGTKDEMYYISIVVHHIAFDGWSVDIFLRELETYYSYYLAQELGHNPKLNLPELTIQYKDFSLWQRSYLSGERLEKQINYWKDTLNGYENLNLITDRSRSEEIDYTGRNIYFEIDEVTSHGLRNLAKSLGVSLYSVLLSGYYLMLRAYTNHDDIVVGTPVSNRHYAQIEHLIGFFVNSLALRMKIDSKQNIKDFIEEVGSNIIESQLYQDLPFEKLVEALEVERIANIHPIFQVMFVLQNFGGNTNKNEPECLKDKFNLFDEMKDSFARLGTQSIARFDISTFINDNSIQLRGTLKYAVRLFNQETIESYINTYKEILSQFASLDNDIKIKDIRYLNTKEYSKIIEVWNNTDVDYPFNKTLHQLFEEQVEKTPNNIALVYKDSKLTYRMLNNYSNCLANYLINMYDIKPNDLVALCLDRDENIIIAILAILKAGCAYIPIDPDYPDERIQSILGEAKPRAVVTNEIYQEKSWAVNIQQNKKLDYYHAISVEQCDLVVIDNKDIISQIELTSTLNPKTFTNGSNLAYIIYTSGTTGNPKGVMIEHRSIINKILYLIQRDVRTIIKVASKIAYSFDPSIREFFIPLLSGSELFLIPDDSFNDPNKLYDYLEKYKINLTIFVPTHLLVFVNNIDNNKLHKLSLLKNLYICGEILTSKLLYKAKKHFVGTNINNQYGPTETCQFSFEFITTERFNEIIPVGKPIDNMKGYVLNKDMMPLPIGAVGELYIGGVGLARGYLNRPDLTQERFIANPFQTAEEKKLDKNGRLYKTGDLVRWLPDGNLEYIGRNDFQVKIRGHRVELGEVEEVLSAYDGIKQSVVVVRDHLDIREDESSKYLVGYYITEDDIDWQEKEILTYLQSRLPDYMVPTRLVRLKEFPLTINGKLDRKKLPEPDFTIGDNYVAPSTDLEKQICKIWSEVLRLPENTVGVHDDFFRLGGNSILAIKVASSMSKSIAIIGVATIFKYRNIEQLSVFLHEMISSNIEGNEYEF